MRGLTRNATQSLDSGGLTIQVSMISVESHRALLGWPHNKDLQRYQKTQWVDSRGIFEIRRDEIGD